MHDTKIDQKLRDIVLEQLGYAPEAIRSDSKIVEDMGADSLDQIELLIAVEEEFNIEIPDEDVDDEQIKTYGEALAFITKKVHEQK